jgi:oxygen-independent coproporphyrinogen-3 oxidase
MPGQLQAPPPLAVYVHLPWCVRKCPYCDFNSHAQRGEIPEQRYLAALTRDLERSLPLVWGREVSSIFIGGGTPSLFTGAGIDELLCILRTLLRVSPVAEITLEANPTSVEAAKLAAFRDAGVNRASLGVQSLNAEALGFLGRRHDVGQAIAALEAARGIFPRLSFDLIYARPGQQEAAWRADLRQALALAADHLSL